jgi:hypothetical protein
VTQLLARQALVTTDTGRRRRQCPAAAPALLMNRMTVCRSSARPFSRGSSSG